MWVFLGGGGDYNYLFMPPPPPPPPPPLELFLDAGLQTALGNILRQKQKR